MKFLIILFTIAMFFGCENATEIDCQDQGGGIIDLVIDDTIPKNKEIEITVIYGKPNPCYVLQEVFTKTTDSSLSFNAKICYQRKKGTVCPSVPVIDSTFKRLILSQTGIISLYIRDTIFVKNIEVI